MILSLTILSLLIPLAAIIIALVNYMQLGTQMLNLFEALRNTIQGFF
jgi:hypothetical protein